MLQNKQVIKYAKLKKKSQKTTYDLVFMFCSGRAKGIFLEKNIKQLPSSGEWE